MSVPAAHSVLAFHVPKEMWFPRIFDDAPAACLTPPGNKGKLLLSKIVLEMPHSRTRDTEPMDRILL